MDEPAWSEREAGGGGPSLGGLHLLGEDGAVELDHSDHRHDAGSGSRPDLSGWEELFGEVAMGSCATCGRRSEVGALECSHCGVLLGS